MRACVFVFSMNGPCRTHERRHKHTANSANTTLLCQRPSHPIPDAPSPVLGCGPLALPNQCLVKLTRTAVLAWLACTLDGSIPIILGSLLEEPGTRLTTCTRDGNLKILRNA